jgi:cellulose 1,4-beta-cellobiosidase
MNLNPLRGAKRTTLRRGLAAGAAAVLAAGGLVVAASQASAAAGCRVDYQANSWSNGFTATVAVTNTGGAAINGWTVRWTWSGNQQLTNGWNATVTQSGTQVSARNAAWNATIPPNASASFGFQASFSGTNNPPTAFTLNGAACAR